MQFGFNLLVGICHQILRPEQNYIPGLVVDGLRTRLWRVYSLEPGGQLFSVHGNARAILTGERTALNFLGRINELPIIDAALLEPGNRYDGRIRALLSKEDIPGPLQLLAFWRKGWSLESEWFRWRIVDK